MSLRTWKRKFYPKAADRVSKAGALDHSILKWTGLLKTKLKEHKLFQDRSALIDPSKSWVDPARKFYINTITCALCHHYCEMRSWDDDTKCPDCPLFKLRGIRCDQSSNSERSPYHAFNCFEDARPMLRLLKRAKAKYETKR